MIDPVCGMEVEPSTAEAAWEHAGTLYYFCSTSCFDRLRKDPEHYVTMDPSERHM